MAWLSTVATLLMFTIICAVSHAKPTRTINLNDTEVAQVNTAMGYSTILQFDGRPSSVVLGDQDAFKVEYVGTSVTIKPLMPGSRSNMFVFTDYDRFNFQLSTGSSKEADYIVQVKRKYSLPSLAAQETKLIVQNVMKWTSSRGVNLKISSVARPKTGSALIVGFSISLNSAKEPPELNIGPGDIEVLQKGRVVPIDSLYLERVALSHGEPLSHGTLVLRSTDFSRQLPLQLTFSTAVGKKTIRLRIPIPNQMASRTKGEKVDVKENKS